MSKIQFKRGLEKDLPILAIGEPGYATDTKTLYIGSASGNVKIAKIDDVNNIQSATVIPNNYSWVSIDGQDTFQISNGKFYDVRLMSVTVGGVVQTNITLIDTKTFQLPETLSAGVTVYIEWYEVPIPVTAGHHATHEFGGQDEIDITRLKNYQEQIATPLTDFAKYAVSASQNGIVGDGITDISVPLQNLVNTIQTNMRNNEFGVSNVIEIPGGKYKMTQTVVIPPYVKLKSRGQVIIHWYGKGSCFWLTPDASDSTTMYIDELSIGQYLKGNLINGDDGGFIILNKNPLSPSNPSTALEIGARAQQPASHMKQYMALYKITNISITGFDVGMLLNTYDHFITNYDNLNLQDNQINVQVGASDGGEYNSGENLSFNHCMFGGGHDVTNCTGFRINAQIEMNFHGCSFDYIDNLFDVNAVCQFRIVAGHIEGITNYIINNQTSDPTSLTFLYPKMYLNKKKLILGNVTVSGGVILHYMDTTTNKDYNNLYLCDSTVNGHLEIKNRANAVCMLQQVNHNKVDYMGTGLYTITSTGGATVTNDNVETINGLSTMALSLPANSSITMQYKYDMNIQKYFAKLGYTMKNLSGLSSLTCQMTIQKKRVGGQMDINAYTFDFSNPTGTWSIPTYLSYFELYKYNMVSFIVTITNNTASPITAKLGDIYLEC